MLFVCLVFQFGVQRSCLGFRVFVWCFRLGFSLVCLYDGLSLRFFCMVFQSEVLVWCLRMVCVLVRCFSLVFLVWRFKCNAFAWCLFVWCFSLVFKYRVQGLGFFCCMVFSLVLKHRVLLWCFFVWCISRLNQYGVLFCCFSLVFFLCGVLV